MNNCALPRIRIETSQPDDEWQFRLDENAWWSDKNIQSSSLYCGGGLPDEKRQIYCERWEKFLELHNILLSIGGRETCFPFIEEDMSKILERGKFWSGKSKMMVGRPSQCHANCANLWSVNHTNKDIRICTGYALTSDGLWRQHSWLTHYYQTATQHRNRIIETTVKRLAYFGFEMTEQEADVFADCNY